MATSDKDTIYIDIDDEITGIIDKLQTSDGKVVALVLPKRAAAFQSIVNMKLLKRAADNSKKHLVLITSEAGLMPLAGAAGVHVASTLTSKPSIPMGPIAIDDGEEAIQEDGQEIDTAKSVGQLAGTLPPSDEVETLVLDDDELPPEDAPAVAGPKTFEPPTDKKGKKPKKDKKLAVPNFERFRLWLILGALLLIVLIGGFVFANASLAKAVITVKTDATNVDVALDFNLSTAAKTVTASNNTIPAKLATETKTFTQQVPTTGQKNNGNKASGNITLVAQVCGSIPQSAPADVPAGTGVSANGLTYITQENTSFSDNAKSKGGCLYFPATDTTDILAQSGGSNYNNANTFTVAGRKDVNGTAASSITGGTDNNVQIVNQNDITSAKSKISATNDATMKATLKSDLQQSQYYAIEATYSAGTPSTTNSANVGDVANNVTVTETVTYTMFGAHKDDLDSLIDNQIKTQIDSDKQSVLDNGLTSATFTVNNNSATSAQLSLATKATAGPDISVDSIKQDAAGKKSGEVKSTLKTNPDVTGVDIKVSPFWSGSIPKDTNRITVNIAKPTTTAKSSNQSDSNP